MTTSTTSTTPQRAPRRRQTCATDDTTELQRELEHYQRGPRELAWKRGWREGLKAHKRNAAFLDWASGQLIGEGGGELCMGARAPLAQILLGLSTIPAPKRPRTIYLTGPDRAGSRPPAAWYAAVTSDGWRMDRWYHSDDHRDRHACEVARGADDEEERYAIRMGAEWFGDETDPRACAAAFWVLRNEITRTFGRESYLYPSPTQTGNYLLQMKLPHGLSFPVLPDGFRAMLHANNSQGRVELLTPKGLGQIPALYCLDARWMYASCVSNMPTGTYTYDAVNEYAIDGKRRIPGFYLVSGRVPKDWKHIGLLPMLEVGKPVRYPSKPGEPILGWVTGAELEVALAPENGWKLLIRRRLLWWERSLKPTDTWVEDLRTLRGIAETRGDKLCAAAYRNLLIRPIGAWASRGTVEEGVLPFDAPAEISEAILARAASFVMEEDGYHWQRRREQVTPQSHVEWAATVWGRARARLAKAALKLPRESLIALRSDGIWTTANPGWPDEGKPGQWRVKEKRETPMDAPHEETDFLELMRDIRAEGAD